GRELLENVVHGSARADVLALIDVSVDAAGERSEAHAVDPRQTYAATLAIIVRDATGVLRTVAARHASELGLAPAASGLACRSDPRSSDRTNAWCCSRRSRWPNIRRPMRSRRSPGRRPRIVSARERR